MSASSSVECDVQCNIDDPVHTIVTISSDNPTRGVLPRDRAEDNIEMVYIRDVLLAQHPFLPEVENAVGRLTDSENADLLNAEALSGLIDPDQILLEALRALSDDPSMRKLQASLEVETNMINLETAAYQTVQTTPFSLMNITDTECTTDTKSCTAESPKTKSRKKFTGSSRSSSRVVKKREKTPPESQKLLKDWLFAHSRHPYPADSEKEQLCMNTGLSLQQLNNWFINARRRILPNYIQEQQRKTVSPETTNSQLYTSHRLQIWLILLIYFINNVNKKLIFLQSKTFENVV